MVGEDADDAAFPDGDDRLIGAGRRFRRQVPTGADQERLEAVHQRVGRQWLERQLVPGSGLLNEVGILLTEQQQRRGALLAMEQLVDPLDRLGITVAIEHGEVGPLSGRQPLGDVLVDNVEAGALESGDVAGGVLGHGQDDGGSIHADPFREYGD